MKNVTELAIARVKKERKDLKEAIKKLKAFALQHAEEIARVGAGMAVVEEWHIRTDIDINSNSLDLSYAGDKHVLVGSFSALRKLGYKPDKRPDDKPMESYTTWFKHPEQDLRIWFKFSSTVCKRQKIGTKMVEQDIFEVVCE
jgi:hypothetical protein